MKKFQVLDNGRAADCTGFPTLHPSWESSIFDSLEEAQQYAAKWVSYPYPVPESSFGYLPNQPYDYSGYGDMIMIKVIESE